MKRPILLFFCMLHTLLYAQETDQRLMNPEKEAFAEQLVQLAWENDPATEIVRRNVDLAEYNVKLSSIEWMSLVSFTGNLNEFNLDPNRDIYNRSQFLPRYNVAANLSLGTLFTIPYNTRRSKEELKIAHSQVEERRHFIRAEVMRLYTNYLLQEKIYTIQVQMAVDREDKQRVTEQAFRNGDITFESYSEARSAQNQASIAFFQAEVSYFTAKVALEELIGVKLEEVE